MRLRSKYSLGPLLLSAFLGISASLNAAVTSLHDFGSVSVNGAAATYAFLATISGVTGTPTLSITGTSFSMASAACTVTSGTATCSATVSFAPQYPGLRTGAIYAKNSSGTLLSTYFFKGVGLSGQLAFTPGIISTLAGTGTWGYKDGALASVTFRNPSGMAMDQSGNLFVADSVNQVVRKITPTAVSTVAGNGGAGYSGDNGAATAATLNNPTGVALDEANNIFIADQGNNLIRRVDAVSGVITTVAGGGSAVITNASSNVQALSAALLGPGAVAVDLTGNLFIADSFHQRILKVNAASGLITSYAGGGTGGSGDGLGDGAAATSAILNNPNGLALDSSSNLYIADTGDNMIRLVNASTGIITVAAGSGGYGYAGDGGAATSAWLKSPMGVRLDAAGNLYIADFGNNVIRQKLAATGMIYTLAGTGINGHSGDGGAALTATLANPTDVLPGPGGTLYVSDYTNNVIRQVTPVAPAFGFASVTTGLASLAQTVTLVNRGNQTLTLSALSLSSSFNQLTSTAGCSAGLALPAGGTCTVEIEFAPMASGAISGSLSLTTNSLNVTGTQTIALSGTGVGGNAPNVVTSVSSISFGAVATGSTQNQSVTLSNTGTGALSISGISLNGNGAFTLSTTCGSSLAAGGTCRVTVTFAPLVSIAYSATLTFTDSAGTSPQQVALSGLGSGGPIGTVSANSIYFSPVVSGAGITQTVAYSNTGSAGLAISGISLSGQNSADFNITTNCGNTLAVSNSCSLSIAFTPAAAGVRTATVTIVDSGAGSPHSIGLSGTSVNTPLQFVPVTPCRVVDTRLANGAFGGPPVPGNSSRSFAIPSGSCGIPANAAAYSLNVTAVPIGGLGYLSVWPAGLPQPLVSLLNSGDGRIKANATILPAGLNGGVSIYVTQTSNVLLDINGYFIAGSSSALSFYPITPCRVADTRLPNAPLGGPYLSGGVGRTFPVLSGTCNIPATAKAYSLNFTAIPRGALYFLSTWPTGNSQPLVSTLNAFTGVITANASIVPAGVAGAINVYASNDADVAVDINGYFAPAASGGLSLYPLTPCRVLDTRNSSGLFNGVLTVNVTGSACGVPPVALSFVFNATVVPPGVLYFLTLWPTGQPQPPVSTLNAFDGSLTSNMAFVPATSGSISAFSSNSTQMFLDISGYFAP